MILIFGGTTEGRMVAKVLDESGASYFYSTRGDLQDIHLAHGIRHTGGMDVTEMTAYCQQHDIRLPKPFTAMLWNSRESSVCPSSAMTASILPTIATSSGARTMTMPCAN